MTSRFRLVCLPVWFALALSLSAQTPGSGLQLDTAPSALEIESCDAGAPLIVVARNSTALPAPSIAVSTVSDAPLTTDTPPLAQHLGAHQEISWQLQVKCASGFNGGNLQVMLRSAASANAGAPTVQILTKSIAVKLREPRSLDNIAAIDVKSTLETLRHGEKGELLLTVTNRTAKKIWVNIEPSGPSFIQFDPLSATQEVAALSTSLVRFTVTAPGRVIPGKQLLLFKVDVTADGASHTYLASREVDVGVLGESEILKLLGVPSLFLLPGFLAVSAFLLLWKWKVWRSGSAADPPLEEGKTGFWVVSITVSLIITGGFLLHRQDFFSYYGLDDLMTVWFVSLLAGSGVYIAWRGIACAIQRTFPQPDDSPLEILRKMKRHSKTMDLNLVTVKGATEPLFLLLSGLGQAYVCPVMSLTWKDDADATIRTNVQDQLKKDGDPGIVVSNLEAGASGIREFKWGGLDPLQRFAHRIDAADIVNSSAGIDIVLKEEN